MAHALYGALIPEIILAHEYLSHVAPINPRLGRTATEVWLVVALIRSFRESDSRQGMEAWKSTIWYLMRESIAKHLRALQTVQSVSTGILDTAPQGIDEFALILYGKSPAAFWRFTHALLTAPEDLRASQVDQLFRAMIEKENFWLDAIIKGKYIKLKDLEETISAAEQVFKLLYLTK